MIRSIAPDELEWFLATHYAFLGHSDPRALARYGVRALHDHAAEADRCLISLGEGQVPLAGLYVQAPEPGEDDQNLVLSNVWCRGETWHLRALLEHVLRKFDHEAVQCPLFNASPDLVGALAPVFGALGFRQQRAFDLEFEVSELPPLGSPLVLEAWTEENDARFQQVFEAAEGAQPSEALWAWLKRWRGTFYPNLWFLAAETLDQEAVGYAFYGLFHDGIDGVYYLSRAGVLAEHRSSSEMLRRLLLSSMQEIAARSPFARIQTLLSQQDPKLLEILESLGFSRKGVYPLFVLEPS